MTIALGVVLDEPDPGRRVALALEAQALGCESLWLPARDADGAFAALGALARETAQVRLGSLAHCFALDETALEPRPTQKPWPRLHLAGESDAALAQAARIGDGWIAAGHSPASIATPLARLRELRARAETLDGRFQVNARVEASDRAELARWRDAGVERLILSLASLQSIMGA